ncbi:MAG TPA: general stress protein [Staphylococcus sp.]|nr:general stress protein [Staphylococcus sp.]
MTEFTIVQNEDELLQKVKDKISEGYDESELTVISKAKLHIDELHNSEVSLVATSGSFSDKMAKYLTGEDGEEVVLSHYDLDDDEKSRYKKEILDNKYILVAVKDTSSHEEVENRNAAYESESVISHHYAEESKGPKS